MEKKLLITALTLIAVVFSAVMMYLAYYPGCRHVQEGILDNGMNNVYKLENKPVFKGIVPQGDGTYTIVAYIDSNTAINLQWLSQQMRNRGFIIGYVGDDYLEYSKTYYNFPSLCTSTWCPKATVYGRVYSNGTILSYIVLGSNDIASLAYLDSNGMIPVVGKAVKDILSILGKQNLAVYIKYALTSHPEAKYIVFMYPSLGWIRGDYYSPEVVAHYTVSSSVSRTLVAGIIHIFDRAEGSGWKKSDIYIDGSLVSRITFDDYGHGLDEKGLSTSRFFGSGTTHTLVMDMNVDYVYGYFVIVAITE